MTPEGSHMRNRRSDLRGLGSTPTSRPQRGRTATGMPICLLYMVMCDPAGVVCLWMSYAAGQDLGSFSAEATKAAEPSDHSATPLGSYNQPPVMFSS